MDEVMRFVIDLCDFAYYLLFVKSQVKGVADRYKNPSLTSNEFPFNSLHKDVLG